MLAEHTIFDRVYAEQASQYIRDQHNYTDAKSYVALCQKTSKETMPHKFVKATEFDQVISQYLGQDCYFSQNSFYRKQRRVDTVRKLTAIWVDIDCYKLGFTAEWTYQKLLLEVMDEGKVPVPNRIVFSGQGLYLVWWIEPTAAKPFIGLWQVLMDYFFSVFKEYGADPQSKDVTRILRVPGSINGKNGVRVVVDRRHDYRYTLQELRDYLPKEVETTKFQPKRGPTTRKVNVSRLMNLHNLYYTRMQDLITLCELRGWRISSNNRGEGKRELVLFLYRYWTLCFTEDKEKALEDAKELNKQFDKPLREREVISATRSAERAWEDKQDPKKNDEARKKGFRQGAGYNYTNDRLIELLDITPEEERKLATIISQDEKRQRNREAHQKVRREAGMGSMGEYLAKRRQNSETKVEVLRDALRTNPTATNKELGDILGVTDRYIKTLKKKL